ncbi:hypothetical protein BDW22DRAFT_1399371 [Trametopsis cervina]|nr:hypothetical protein BDW22DRAFT_1399371 [Trametopsis cervina]
MNPSGHAGKPAPNGDRYAALQRKVEDLERIHAESKKAHQAELERLKLELSRSQRQNVEHAERIDKLKKQSAAQDARMQELKKTSTTDQAEIKDLRVKLRMSEHERTQLAAKQGEAGDAKRAVHTLEAKRREEARERERKVAELEKAVVLERKRREGAEEKLAEAMGKVEGEVQDARAAAEALEKDLRETRTESEQSKSALNTRLADASHAEAELLAQLEDHKAMLSRVAQEYGRLASSTVAKSQYERVRGESRALQLRVNRLERKFANTEGQVVELANFIRHTQDQNALLAAQLREAEEQLVFCASMMAGVPALENALDDIELAKEVYMIGRESRDAEVAVRVVDRADNQLWEEHDRLRRGHLALHAGFLLRHVDEAQREVERLDKGLNTANQRIKKIELELTTSRSEHDTARSQLVETTSSLAVARGTEESLKKKVETIQAEKVAEVAKVQRILKQEREAGQRLSNLLHQSAIAEQALNAELDRMAADLTEAERYREAYCSMIDEVDALVRKNALAEDEARKLSKFNAAILGHNNPQQRIMYVDKIRQELHETKQTLLLTTRDKETVISDNDELRHELELYKSVGVPVDFKPRTTVTRVTRAPLVSQNLNALPASRARSNSRAASGGGKRIDVVPELEYKEGDMTVDELDAF